MIRNPLSRRMLLRGAGGIAMGLPFLEAMLPRRVHAATPMAPRRLVLFFSPNGTIIESWKPSGSDTNFQLGPILSPLQSHQSDLLIINGLKVGEGGPGDGHQQGMAHLWTNAQLQAGGAKGGCGTCASAGFSNGPSIDQVIAKAQTTAQQFVALGVLTPRDKDAWTRMCYSGPGAAVDPEPDPMAAFKNIFTAVPQTSSAQQAFQKLQQERKTVVDAVLASYAGVKPQLSGNDLQRMEAHFEFIQTLQKEVSATASPIACMPPMLGGKIDPNANDSMPQIMKMQMDIAAAALACGVTNVVSIQSARSVSDVNFTWLGIHEGHHALSHKDGDPAVQAKLVQINTWYASQFGYLLDRLKSFPEGPGTVLDNTVALWGNELARGGAHSHKPMPFVLSGRCGGAIKTGRFLDLEKDQPYHSALLIALANAMGVNITSFGDPQWQSPALTLS